MTQLTWLKSAWLRWSLIAGLGVSGAVSANSVADYQFGVGTGSAGAFVPMYANTKPAGPEWGNADAANCRGVDFNSFVTNNFKSSSLIAEWGSLYQTGERWSALQYIMALNTGNPTLANSLEVMDKVLANRYQSFVNVCQANDRLGMSAVSNDRRKAIAINECFSYEVMSGSTEPHDSIMRKCRDTARLSTMQQISANKATVELFKNHTSLDVTPDLEALFSLVPDEVITAVGPQRLPAKRSISLFYYRSQQAAELAITEVLNGGRKPIDIAVCDIKLMLADDSPAQPCVSKYAVALVNNPAMASARGLPAAQRRSYVAAVAEQIASVTVLSAISELSLAIESAAPTRTGVNATVQGIANRKASLATDLAALRADAKGMQDVAAARMEVWRTNLLAMQQAQGIAQLNASRLNPAAAPEQTGGALRDAARMLGIR